MMKQNPLRNRIIRVIFGLLSLVLLALNYLPRPVHAHEGLVHEGCVAEAVEAGDLTISGAFTRAMLPNAKAAGGYVTIENKGSADDRLIGVTSEAAQLVQLHEMKMDGEMMKMGEVPGGIPVAAGETVALTPGGFHIMFMGVGTPFAEGECVEVTLQFETAGEVPVVLPIGDPAADAAPDHAGH
jgi:periplasmic copper chaperone A